jgi:hypothetical protein
MKRILSNNARYVIESDGKSVRPATKDDDIRYILTGDLIQFVDGDNVSYQVHGGFRVPQDLAPSMSPSNDVDLQKNKDACNQPSNIYSGASANAPITTDSTGASQSATSLRFDLIPAIELAEIAKVLAEGEVKYPSRDGVPNWHGISTNDHLNHALQHIYAYLGGDRSDSHLAHAATRLIFAMFTSKGDSPVKFSVKDLLEQEQDRSR